MARDNSPKERQRRHLERKLGRRAAYDRILIVTEGSKTEPNYFREIRNAYRLHTANVSIHPGALGTAPIHVVDYARQLFEGGDRHKQIAPRAFDQVYAVFDRDAHESYHEALQRAEQLDGKLRSDARRPVPFKAVASVPSFELWLLLHYENIQAPIHRDEALARLQQSFPGYEKGAANAFATTSAHYPTALERAARLAEKFTAHDEPEPYTGVATLVDLLVNLQSR
jgi:RloB-like protein